MHLHEKKIFKGGKTEVLIYHYINEDERDKHFYQMQANGYFSMKKNVEGVRTALYRKDFN